MAEPSDPVCARCEKCYMRDLYELEDAHWKTFNKKPSYEGDPNLLLPKNIHIVAGGINVSYHVNEQCPHVQGKRLNYMPVCRTCAKSAKKIYKVKSSE